MGLNLINIRMPSWRVLSRAATWADPHLNTSGPRVDSERGGQGLEKGRPWGGGAQQPHTQHLGATGLPSLGDGGDGCGFGTQ